MNYQQQPPFSIQIEMTEGCNLFCNFCGINGIRKGPGDYKFMTVDTAGVIASAIRKSGWNPRIEFAMHGEPTMNPLYLNIINIFRKRLPNHQLTMLTNGIVISAIPPLRIRQLFEAGLNLLAIDDYGHKAAERLRSKFYGIHSSEYPKENASPHKRWPIGTKEIIYIQDIRTASKGGHSRLVNHCGSAGPPLKRPLQLRCAKPFRELAIRWDGNVAICCEDYRGEFHAGCIWDQTIEQLWNNDQFTSARRFLYQGDRASLFPCRICNARSFRVGFLPDKMGKETLPKPTEQDKRIVTLACCFGPYTKRVERNWEPDLKKFWGGEQ